MLALAARIASANVKNERYVLSLAAVRQYISRPATSSCGKGAKRMLRSKLIALTLSAALAAGCQSDRSMTAAPQAAASAAEPESTVQGTVVGDDRTSMEAAIDAGSSGAAPPPEAASGSPVINPNAPDNYVVKRGDTLWGIAKVFLRDPWFWPEIWQVNPQIQNPHLIYPGDTLRLVYIEGRPTLMLQRGDAARVLPRVRSQPLESAVTTIPYETVAAFMSKPSVLTQEQIKGAPYVLATRDMHVVMSDGDTLYARGFTAPAELGTHYNVVRVGEALRDPDDNKILGYHGIYNGSGHVTRVGDPATLIMTDSTRETEAGDKLFAGGIDVPLDFIPAAPKTKVNGRIMAVSDGVSVIGQYEVVVINRGARDGLVPGNVLAVYEAGQEIRDTANKGFLGSMSRLAAPKVRLPDERSGTFMVFKTFDNMSYGLIMEATTIIRIADRVENP
jgi:LysM domain-containing protein